MITLDNGIVWFVKTVYIFKVVDILKTKLT
jgi:hypothetical protein